MNKTVYFVVVVLTAFLVQLAISDGGRQLGKQTSNKRIDKNFSRDLDISPAKPSLSWHQSTLSPPRSDDNLPSSQKYLARNTSSDDLRADGRADHPKKVRSRKGNEKKRERAGSPSRLGLGRPTSFDEEDRSRPEMVNDARRPSPDTRAKASNSFDKNRYMPEMVNVTNRPSLHGTEKVGRSSFDEGDRFGPEEVNVASPDKAKDYARAKTEHPSKRRKERGDSKSSARSKSFNSWVSWSSQVKVPSPKWNELPSRRTLLQLMTKRGKPLENLPMEPGDVVVCHLVKQRIVSRFHWFLAVSGSELLHLISRDTKNQGLFVRDEIDKVQKRYPAFDCNNCRNLGSGGYNVREVEDRAARWVNRVTFYDEDSCSGYHWIVWWITSTIPKPVRFLPGFNRKLHRDCRLNTIQRDPDPLATDVLLLPSMEEAAAYAREFQHHAGWPVEVDGSSE